MEERPLASPRGGCGAGGCRLNGRLTRGHPSGSLKLRHVLNYSGAPSPYRPARPKSRHARSFPSYDDLGPCAWFPAGDGRGRGVASGPGQRPLHRVARRLPLCGDRALRVRPRLVGPGIGSDRRRPQPDSPGRRERLPDLPAVGAGAIAGGGFRLGGGCAVPAGLAPVGLSGPLLAHFLALSTEGTSPRLTPRLFADAARRTRGSKPPPSSAPTVAGFAPRRRQASFCIVARSGDRTSYVNSNGRFP